MNEGRFDELAKGLATNRFSRRQVLKRLAAGVLLTGPLGALWPSEVEAKKKKKKKKSCPPCGTCTTVDIDSATHELSVGSRACQDPCAAANLCNKANSNANYQKLMSYLRGDGFVAAERPESAFVEAGGKEPFAVEVYTDGAKTRSVLLSHFTKTATGEEALVRYSVEVNGEISMYVYVSQNETPQYVLVIGQDGQVQKVTKETGLIMLGDSAEVASDEIATAEEASAALVESLYLPQECDYCPTLCNIQNSGIWLAKATCDHLLVIEKPPSAHPLAIGAIIVAEIACYAKKDSLPTPDNCMKTCCRGDCTKVCQTTDHKLRCEAYGGKYCGPGPDDCFVQTPGSPRPSGVCCHTSNGGLANLCDTGQVCCPQSNGAWAVCCSGGNGCVDGQCAPCTNHSQCRAGQVCSDGQCREASSYSLCSSCASLSPDYVCCFNGDASYVTCCNGVLHGCCLYPSGVPSCTNKVLCERANGTWSPGIRPGGNTI